MVTIDVAMLHSKVFDTYLYQGPLQLTVIESLFAFGHSSLIQDCFTAKAELATNYVKEVEGLDLDKVMIIPRADILNASEMPKFESKKTRKNNAFNEAEQNTPTRVLFISHRWGRDLHPDDADNQQLEMMKIFLETKEVHHRGSKYLRLGCIIRRI